MRTLEKTWYARPLAVYLTAALIAFSSAVGPAEAMLLPPAGGDTATSTPLSAARAADLAKVQKFLEARTVQQRLQDYGLTADEALARVNGLSDEQLHRFAANVDAVQAGGDALSTLLGLVVIALLVVLIIYLLEGRIAIQRK